MSSPESGVDWKAAYEHEHRLRMAATRKATEFCSGKRNREMIEALDTCLKALGQIMPGPTKADQELLRQVRNDALATAYPIYLKYRP